MDVHGDDLNYDPKLEGGKYTSYKTMKCYNLVFNSKLFIKNAGSIIVLIFLIGYVNFIMYFIIKHMSFVKSIV